MSGILNLIVVSFSYLAAMVSTAAPATGDQAMKLIVPMIALIIVAVVLVVIVIYMSNKDKNKKNGKKNAGGFSDSDFK
jgi:FtsH-binding integral membrane protein